MFASRVTKQVILTDESGEAVTVTIRKLSGGSLEKAAQAHQGQSLSNLRHMGGEIAQAFRQPIDFSLMKQLEKQKTPEEQRREQYDQYDRTAILRAGVQSWTSKVDVETGVDDLDEATMKLLFEEILELSLPPMDRKELEAIPKGD